MKSINNWAYRLKQIRWYLFAIAFMGIMVLGRIAFNNAHEALPPFTVDRMSIHFFSKPDSLTTGKEISFYSDGNWTATANAPGITVSPTHGKASKKPIILELSVNTRGLSVGAYEGSIVISKTDSSNSAVIPVTLYVTEAEIGQVAEIRIIGDPTSVITLEDAMATYGALSYLAMNPWEGSNYNPGDLCLEISGVFRNNSTSEFIDYWAEGYDSNGKQITWTLSSGAIMGHSNVSIPPQGTGNFTLTLSWAEGISEIKFFMNAYEKQPP